MKQQNTEATRSIAAHARSFQQVSWPSAHLLSRGLRPTPFHLGDERGDGSADRLGVILLQEVEAVAELDEPAMLELTDELFRVSRGDERARLCGEEEFWIRRRRQRPVRLLHRRIDVGGLAGDRQFVREAPGRAP